MKKISNNVKLSVIIRERIINGNMTGKIINWSILNNNVIKHLKHWFIIEEKENGFIFNNKRGK